MLWRKFLQTTYQRQIPVSKRYMALTVLHRDYLDGEKEIPKITKESISSKTKSMDDLLCLKNPDSGLSLSQAGNAIDYESARVMSCENLIDIGPESDDESSDGDITDDSEGRPALQYYFDNQEPFVIEL